MLVTYSSEFNGGRGGTSGKEETVETEGGIGMKPR